MKYRIIGADGKMYGPIGLEQIKQWLAEGRTNNRTPVYVEGASTWTYLGLLPELAGELAVPRPTPAPLAPAATPAPIAAPAPARGTNGFATAGLVCGLLSWACCCCLPFNLLGLAFSIIALVQIASQPQPQEGRLFAIMGLGLSASNLFFGLAAVLLNLALNPGSITWQMGTFQ